MLDSRPLLLATDFPVIKRGFLDTLQVNLGYKCNLSCVHCHVNAGPNRTEMMDRQTVELILQFLDHRQIQTLDLTGGAPELNPHFRYLVAAARERGIEVIDRCNLTVLFEPGQEDLAEFLAEHRVTITASLPCYLEDNVEKQRGKGVYRDSISALQYLNKLGYGRQSELALNLVYNPVGPVLPPPQEQLQADYQRELKVQFGIDFNQLFTITNMPVSRFGSVLMSHGELEGYMSLLKENFSEANLQTVMCRSLISVDWQGYVYDCDFNQMLNLPMQLSGEDDHDGQLGNEKLHLRDLLSRELAGNEINIADHCFGCTAGQGSSCGGALHD